MRPRRVLLLLTSFIATVAAISALSYAYKDRISSEVTYLSYYFSPAHRVPPYVPPLPQQDGAGAVSQGTLQNNAGEMSMQDNAGEMSKDAPLFVSEDVQVYRPWGPPRHDTLEYSTDKPLLPDDLRGVRRALLGGAAGKRAAKESGWWRDMRMSEEDILRDKWYRFGGAPLWLAREGCYVVYTRVAYSRVGRRNRPHLSVVRGQAFDANWNELHGKYVPFLDTAQSEQYDGDSGVTYPAFFEVPFDVECDWNGPEDPHVVAVDSPRGPASEPLIVFNMFSRRHGRGMYVLRPHRQLQPLTRLQMPPGLQPRLLEKNWTPVQETSAQGDSTTHLLFVYALAPLRVLRCALDSGACATVYAAPALGLPDWDVHGEDVRGGTQFVPLPPGSLGPGAEYSRAWVGFPKLHTVLCGCGREYYRPMLAVLTETAAGDDVPPTYALEALVPTLGFGIDVRAWDLQGSHCDMLNVLAPNAIARWDVGKSDDYMTITVSEADAQTRVVVLRGVLGLVRAALDARRQSGVRDVSRMVAAALQDAEQQCARYGQLHTQ
ncbi:hypothetical protein DAKH74_023020 [Maudiozyma humilis]|uniref:Uncharacterized protein n=1 Tax=Maudiozyma humilis TaxID=51915 RepID=A0AAV5RX00_MAUHU|nr:hypothetical protein DAKH74_023020 [Kazachstania humilis]